MVDKMNKFISIFTLIICLFFFSFTIYGIVNFSSAFINSKKVEATVSNVEINAVKNRYGTVRPNCNVSVEYEVDGEKYVGLLKNVEIVVEKGDKINIHYNKSNPTEIKSNMNYTIYIVLLFCLFMTFKYIIPYLKSLIQTIMKKDKEDIYEGDKNEYINKN